MKNNILVIGGTGKTGRRVIENLSALEHNVRVGSRNGEPAFDWNDPSTYAQALKGMDRAYIVYYPDLAVPGAKEAISQLADAALQEGLKKVVLLSGKGEKEAEACEDIIAGSGLDYTIVRASWFNQNFSESFLMEPILAGMVQLPMPEAKIPFVDADDIADVVAKVLLDDSFNGQILTLTGPERLTFEEVIQYISAATGRSIEFQAISLTEYSRQMKASGLPDDYVWLFTYLFREVLGNEENHEVSKDIEKVLGRRATSFEKYATAVAKTGVWNVPVAI